MYNGFNSGDFKRLSGGWKRGKLHTTEVAMATNPTSESELQLYRVLQRSNLLQYFETFISQGGDDVQQLCEAGEEEFLEIMALVGMASKPLHVRRLQKALQEWVTSPVYQQPLGPHTPPPPVAPGSILASVQRPYLKLANQFQLSGGGAWPGIGTGDLLLGPGLGPGLGPVSQSVSPVSVSGMETGKYTEARSAAQQQQVYDVESAEYASANMMMSGDDRMTGVTSPGPPPQLTEGQLEAIERSAEELAKSLPHYEPKPLNTKKLINKEIEEVMKMPTEHPERMDLLRKYGCIYGRFDSRRKNEKQLSLHEISVNEASAQLCRHRVTLLTRRDDLFPMARQVVRDSGYQYSKGHSRGQNVEIPPNKKPRMESFVFSKQYESMLGMAKALGRKSPQKTGPEGRTTAEGRLAEEKRQREIRMAEINQELSSTTARQQAIKRQLLQTNAAPDGAEQATRLQAEHQQLMTRQLQLLTEQSDLLKKQRSARRTQYRRSLNKECHDDSAEDDDEDSMPFPSETFSGNDTEADYFAPSAPTKSPGNLKLYSQSSLYQEGMRMIQKYSMTDNSLSDGNIEIKQEVDPDTFQEELEPGEVDPSTIATWHLPVTFSSRPEDHQELKKDNAKSSQSEAIPDSKTDDADPSSKPTDLSQSELAKPANGSS